MGVNERKAVRLKFRRLQNTIVDFEDGAGDIAGFVGGEDRVKVNCLGVGISSILDPWILHPPTRLRRKKTEPRTSSVTPMLWLLRLFGPGIP